MSGGQTTNTPERRRPRRDEPQAPPEPDRTLYRKIVSDKGRVRYVPHGEMWALSSLQYGEWLISCSPGRTAMHRLDDPDDDQVTIQRAALVAAARTAEDAMVRAMMEASRLKPSRTLSTPAEQRAWKAYCRELGSDEALMMQRPCIQDIVNAGIEALIDAVTGLTEENMP